MNDIQARVARGVAFLDRAQPGWADRIDIGTLNMAVCRSCILGQLFGHFHEGIRQLSLITPGASAERPSRLASLYGFDIIAGEPTDSTRINSMFATLQMCDDSFRHLQKAWIAEIVRRRHATEPVANAPELIYA